MHCRAARCRPGSDRTRKDGRASSRNADGLRCLFPISGVLRLLPLAASWRHRVFPRNWLGANTLFCHSDFAHDSGHYYRADGAENFDPRVAPKIRPPSSHCTMDFSTVALRLGHWGDRVLDALPVSGVENIRSICWTIYHTFDVRGTQRGPYPILL